MQRWPANKHKETHIHTPTSHTNTHVQTIQTPRAKHSQAYLYDHRHNKEKNPNARTYAYNHTNTHKHTHARAREHAHTRMRAYTQREEVCTLNHPDSVYFSEICSGVPKITLSTGQVKGKIFWKSLPRRRLVSPFQDYNEKCKRQETHSKLRLKWNKMVSSLM